MRIFVIFVKLRYYDFCKNHNFDYDPNCHLKRRLKERQRALQIQILIRRS